jgi:hypothetical protein
MPVGQLPETLYVLFFDATPLLRIREHRSMMHVYQGPPTCSQSAICVFNWLTCFIRPLRTSTAWFGERLCYTLDESGVTRLAVRWQLTSTAGYSFRCSSIMTTAGTSAQSYSATEVAQ